MSDAEIIRAVYPRHTMKRLARAAGLALDTARHWLYRGVAPHRRRELARVLLAQLERDEAARAALRRRLSDMAR